MPELKMPPYGRHHVMFLQGIMCHRVLEGAEVKKLYKCCCDRNNVPYSSDDLASVVTAINQKIRPFHMEIKKGTDESNGKQCYVLIATTESNLVQLTSSLSAPELELFQKIVNGIVCSEVGSISSVSILNMPDNMVKRLGKLEVQECLTKFIKEKWFCTNLGDVSLAPRSILELETYLREMYPNSAVSCLVCKLLVIMGQRCDSCDSKMHNHCAQKFSAGRENPKCPSCGAIWPIVSSRSDISASGSDASQRRRRR